MGYDAQEAQLPVVATKDCSFGSTQNAPLEPVTSHPQLGTRVVYGSMQLGPVARSLRPAILVQSYGGAGGGGEGGGGTGGGGDGGGGDGGGGNGGGLH